MGAVALTIITQGTDKNKRTVTADCVMSGAYATGGDTVAMGNLGLKNVTSAHILAGDLSAQADGSVPFTVLAHGIQLMLAGASNAPKLKAYHGTTSEVSAATDLSAVPAVRVEFRGN